MQTVRAPAEDSFPTAQAFPPPAAQVSPLAKAALEQGVRFEDVVAYLQNLRTARKGWR
jgi:hypothetical protein